LSDGAGILLQLSDLHLREDSTGPAGRLERAVRRASSLRPAPDAVLLSGDLADVPSSAAYEQVHELVSALGVPVHAIPGNHDDRDMLRARFAPGSGFPGEPVRFAVECGELRLVGCDSTVPGREGGALDAEQLDWLEPTLAERREQATLLALHHPPVLTGVRAMDAIPLARENSIALEALLERNPHVLAVTCGHVHTAMSTSFAGRPLLVCPSTNSALRLDLRPDDEIPFAVAEQPLGFALHTLIDGRLVSHIQPIEQE
jgi:Icc protein